MRALVLRLDNIGMVAAEDLALRMRNLELVLADSRRDRLDDALRRVPEADAEIVDIADVVALNGLFKRVDIACSALPGKLAKNAWNAAIQSGTSLVDVSYAPEDPLAYAGDAKRAGIVIVPDAGLAPGLSSMLAGCAYSSMDQVNSLRVLVGGLPQRPMPPLDYSITGSVEDLIEEYTRPARVIRAGKLVQLPALSEMEFVNVPGVGRLEAFLTDGLRTMLQTMPRLTSMDEKTLRWPGHAERIALLRDLGLLKEQPIEVDGCSIAPRKLLAEILSRELPRDQRDLVVLIVEATGRRSGDRIALRYTMVDRYDEGSGTTAMARTTSYTMTGILSALTNGMIEQPGVVPPEVLGMQDEVLSWVLDWLREKDIRVSESSRII